MRVTKTQLGQERLLFHTESGVLVRAQLHRLVDDLNGREYRLILKAKASTEWKRHALDATSDDDARLKANELIKSFGLKLAKSA